MAKSSLFCITAPGEQTIWVPTHAFTSLQHVVKKTADKDDFFTASFQGPLLGEVGLDATQANKLLELFNVIPIEGLHR